MSLRVQARKYKKTFEEINLWKAFSAGWLGILLFEDSKHKRRHTIIGCWRRVLLLIVVGLHANSQLNNPRISSAVKCLNKPESVVMSCDTRFCLRFCNSRIFSSTVSRVIIL